MDSQVWRERVVRDVSGRLKFRKKVSKWFFEVSFPFF